MKNLHALATALIIVLAIVNMQDASAQRRLPNILWITSEDNSPMLGCYGDQMATTPNLDKLAAEGFLYTHAYSNAPVCAPSRNTIVTGVYANSNGNQHMRSYYDKSDVVKLYPELLRQAGYYCTNRLKEDFNINPEQTKNVWDEVGPKAHYRNRPAGKPFFAIFNSVISHESSLHKSIPDDQLRHKPADVTLPPYHPDTPELRHDWAQYYDKVEDMDTWVGTILKDLKESGEAENTIVFYYSDHGGILPRSKRYVYETGTRVPLIIHIPEKFKDLYPAIKPGSTVDRMVSFVDLAPTLLSIIGQDAPSYMQGNAFLGPKQKKPQEYVFMFRGRMDERCDMSRAVRDRKFRYIRNYMPYRIYGQYLEYLWRAPGVRSWEEACKAGKCNATQAAFWNTKPVDELYDTENDPWEIHNLAEDPKYKKTLQRMRKSMQDWMIRIDDTGFIPEEELIEETKGTTAYDYMRSGAVALKELIRAADFAIEAKPGDQRKLTDMLSSPVSSVRYWGATGLLILGDKATHGVQRFKIAANDTALSVAIVAAEGLYKLGEQEKGREALIRAIRSPNAMTRTHALNVVDYVNDNSQPVRDAVVAMLKDVNTLDRREFDQRCARQLFEKWNLNPADFGIEINW